MPDMQHQDEGGTSLVAHRQWFLSGGTKGQWEAEHARNVGGARHDAAFDKILIPLQRHTNLHPNNNLQRHPKAPSPAPSRLAGLNYAMMKETALKAKLRELGIPDWGKKDLLQRRHTEWLHLWNSNCDASDERRKTKRELLKELDVWEKTRGGRAQTVEATVMKKDFDTKGYVDAHKDQFAHLIAAARQKRGPKKNETEEEKIEGKKKETDDEQSMRENDEEWERGTNSHEAEYGANLRPPFPEHLGSPCRVEARAGLEAETSSTELKSQNGTPTVNTSRPYEGNEAALASIRDKVEETNRRGAIISPPSRNESSLPLRSDGVESTGMPNPLGSPTKRLPMFALPEDPIVDVENATASQ